MPNQSAFKRVVVDRHVKAGRAGNVLVQTRLLLLHYAVRGGARDCPGSHERTLSKANREEAAESVAEACKSVGLSGLVSLSAHDIIKAVALDAASFFSQDG